MKTREEIENIDLKELGEAPWEFAQEVCSYWKGQARSSRKTTAALVEALELVSKLDYRRGHDVQAVVNIAVEVLKQAKGE